MRGISTTTHGLPRQLYLLTITTITLFLASQITQPILSLYITEKGATNFELGIIVSLLSFVAIGAKIPLGIIAEHVGKWSIIPAVAIGQTISMVLYSIVPDPAWFIPVRVFHALVLAAYVPTALAITQDLSPEGRKGITMGVFLTSVGVTSTLGPFLCTFLVSYLSYEQVFQTAAIIPLLGLIPYFLVSREKGSNNPNDGATGLSLRESLGIIASSRIMLLLTYLRLAFSFANAFFITFFAIHATENLILSSSLIALLFGIKGAANMVSRIPSGRLADRIGYNHPITIAFALLTIAFLALSQTYSIYLLALAMVMYGAAHGMRAVAEWSMLGDHAPPEARNVATAYLSTIFNVGAAFGAVTAGALSVVMGIPSMFRLASIIVFSGVIILMLRKRVV